MLYFKAKRTILQELNRMKLKILTGQESEAEDIVDIFNFAPDKKPAYKRKIKGELGQQTADLLEKVTKEVDSTVSAALDLQKKYRQGLRER